MRRSRTCPSVRRLAPADGEWWSDVWSSPMSPEWDDSDIHNVYIAAAIYDDMWTAETAKERKDAAAEYRLQRVDLGLSPYSRRRLEWTIESTEEAKDRGKRRRNGTPQQPSLRATASPTRVASCPS